MLESPKKRFLQTPDAKRLWDIVGEPAVMAGLDASMLQLQVDIGHLDDPVAGFHQLVGAKKMRDKFLTISEVEKPATTPKTYNLPEQ